jgi:hypothetical protein
VREEDQSEDEAADGEDRVIGSLQQTFEHDLH